MAKKPNKDKTPKRLKEIVDKTTKGLDKIVRELSTAQALEVLGDVRDYVQELIDDVEMEPMDDD